MNRHILGKVNSKNNSCQYIHTCCFVAELRVSVLKIAVENLEYFLKMSMKKFIFRKVSNHFHCIYFSMNFTTDSTTKFSNQQLFQ